MINSRVENKVGLRIVRKKYYVFSEVVGKWWVRGIGIWLLLGNYFNVSSMVLVIDLFIGL